MNHQVPSLKAALGRLYADLQTKQVRGVVPYQVFRSETEALGLSEEARGRLADALTAMKLRIGEPPRQEAERAPAQRRAASPRMDTARRLLDRFADRAGMVDTRAVDRVARLAGLSVSETEELRSGARIIPSPDGAATAPDPRGAPPGAALSIPAQAAPVAAGHLERAVTAARDVLTDDRFTLRPAKRILTAEEEVGLTVLLRGGVRRMGIEPTDEELAGLLPEDERRRARDCLVVHNLGLVHSLARQFTAQGLDYEDLAQSGKLGLLRAARKFDPLMGIKFSTYATQWVRQMIGRAVADEGSAIRVPVHMHEVMQKVARAERALLSRGLPIRAADVAVACDLPVTKVDEVRRLSRRTDSLDRTIGDGVHLGDLIETRTAIPGVEGTVIDALTEAELHAAVAALPERFARIVTRRYGLDGQDPATLDELGKALGVTRERVRQLEVKVRPVLKLAFTDPAGAPYLTLRRMLTDKWLDAASSNAVYAISKDLANRDWLAGVNALQTFRRREGGRLPEPDHQEGDFPLGQWIDEQREIAGFNGAGLPTHRRVVLESLGVEWQRAPLPVRKRPVPRPTPPAAAP
ncbi:sigma-70 family RNA polymerase sigma factor [Kitasatospora aureofaciens]|uniref:sigma-70 family RNA polymerase sigma factor n=1 Tax=Kitasatospora aureofaciens TaxID=1894 RepID=UPI001C443B69|nr:sigma-70 family RNA polymerase sigma factor [Kitasatospora aureofaciens]MBV6695899.1 sigma-70 family RNA polymerase sigma factor [Kitasatospora aureofaciens]